MVRYRVPAVCSLNRADASTVYVLVERATECGCVGLAVVSENTESCSMLEFRL